MTITPTAAASAREGTRFRTASTQAKLRPCLTPKQIKANPTSHGKNSRLENLESTSNPPETPRNRPCFQEGFSAQMIPVRKVSPRSAVSPASVVARPECARIVGVKLKKKKAR